MATAKAAEDYTKVVRDELSCPICLEDFEEPKSLPKCAHNICKQCLGKMLKNKKKNKVECPICRKKSSIPDIGIDGFPTNTLLKRLVDNQPGRKEMHEIMDALQSNVKELKEMKLKIQSIQNDKDRVISSYKDQCLQLEKEVAISADEIVKQAREEEQQLYAQIKRYLAETCKAYDKIFGQKDQDRFEDMCEQAKQYFKQVEYTIKSKEPEKVIELKDKTVDDIQQRISTLEQSIINPFDECELPFDLKYKGETNECLLGKVLKKSDSQTKMIDNLGNTCQSKGTSTLGILGSELEDGSSSASNKEKGSYPRYFLPSPFTSSGVNATSRKVESAETLIKLVNLRFMPTSFAVSPNTEKVAILCAEKKEVHIFSPSYKHLKTIHIQSGVLTDVTFSANEEIIVVNRANSRLLFFTKEGKFLRKYLKGLIPNLKFTCIFVDKTGRHILTSTPSEGTMDTGVGHPCVVVFNVDREFCFTFGKQTLRNPYGKAIYHNNIFYVPDDGSTIKSFDDNGVLLFEWAVHDTNPMLHLAINPLDNTALVVNQSKKTITTHEFPGKLLSAIKTVSGVPKFITVINGERDAQSKVLLMNDESIFLEIHALLPH